MTERGGQMGLLVACRELLANGFEIRERNGFPRSIIQPRMVPRVLAMDESSGRDQEIPLEVSARARSAP